MFGFTSATEWSKWWTSSLAQPSEHLVKMPKPQAVSTGYLSFGVLRGSILGKPHDTNTGNNSSVNRCRAGHDSCPENKPRLRIYVWFFLLWVKMANHLTNTFAYICNPVRWLIWETIQHNNTCHVLFSVHKALTKQLWRMCTLQGRNRDYPQSTMTV